LHRDKLPVDDLLLVLYYADHGSESDEKLRLLASMVQAPASGIDRPLLKRLLDYRSMGLSYSSRYLTMCWIGATACGL